MTSVQNIGLMVTNNEEDVIEEVMEVNKKYFDKILVLDGSNDRTEEILRSYDCVKYLLKDEQIIDRLPGRKFNDYARQYLIDKAQELYPVEGWFTLLHGDEIWQDDPNWVAAEAEKARAEKVNWYVMNFFLHSSDKERDLAAIRSVQERVLWYCPGFLEIRSFRNKPGLHYNFDKKWCVLPEGIGWQIYKHFPVYKHYPFRSVEQIMKKKAVQAKNDYITYQKFFSADDCFVDILPNCKVTRKYDGSFHEFEIKEQGTLFSRWLRGRKYITW